MVRRTESGRRAAYPWWGDAAPDAGRGVQALGPRFGSGPHGVPGAGLLPSSYRAGELSDLSSSVALVLKLGLRLELYRSPTVQVPYDLVQLAEELGFHSVWTAEAYGADALTPLAAIAARDRAHQARHRGGAARRPPAGDARHAGDDGRRARRRRAHDRRHRPLGPADRRGLVRPAVGQAQRAAARLRRDPARRAAARGAGHPRRPGDLAAVHRARARSGRASRCKSILHPPSDIPIWLASVGPRNTALLRRAVRRLVADGPAAAWHRRSRRRRRARAGFARRADGRRSAARLRRVQRAHGEDHRRREGLARRHPPVPRHVRRRHGQRVAQLPRRVDGQARLRRRRGAHPGAVPRRPARRGDRGDARRGAAPGHAGRHAREHPAAVGGGRHRAARRHRCRSWAPTGPTSSSSSPNSRGRETEWMQMSELRDDWEATLADLEQRRAAGRAMGGEERLAKHHGQGKLDARARIDAARRPRLVHGARHAHRWRRGPGRSHRARLGPRRAAVR